MDYLERALKRKEQELSNLIEQTRQSLQRVVVSGNLRIATRDGHPQFYHTDFDREKNCRTDVYIPKNKIGLVYELAQKDYDTKLIKMAEEQLKQIVRLSRKYNATELMDVYENCNEIRKSFIAPAILPDEQYVREWEAEEYEGKSIGEGVKRYKTEKGEYVRSKSEKIIADFYFHHGIPYKYEKPLYLKGIGTIYPDFTVLNPRTRKEYYHEHLGMMDEKGYAEGAVSRIEMYRINGYLPGIRLLLSFETSKQSLDISVLEDFVKWYLQ